MKIIALINNASCPSCNGPDEALCLIDYSVGDRSLSTSVFVQVDLTQTEDQIRDAIRTAVAADSNSKCVTQVTAADVRVF